jgi:hypothetical protein
VSAAAKATGLRGMLPTSFAGGTLTSLRRGGEAVPVTHEVVKGVEYALFPALTGSYTATYGADTAPPEISAVTATADADGTATVTWATDEASSSAVDYGTGPGSLDQTAGAAGLVTSHSVPLTGITPGATYHYRVRSADAGGNSATSPAPPAAPATFTVPETASAAPATTTIQTGTAAGGNAAALGADDNAYFRVRATTSGTRTTAWYGTFTGVPNSLGDLRVSYTGRNTASCTQTVHVWNWTTSAWTQLSSRSVGSTEIALGNLAPPGAAANYVSGTSGDGDLRVRVRCTRSSNFVAEGDLMRIGYQR